MKGLNRACGSSSQGITCRGDKDFRLNGLPATRVPCASRGMWRSPKLAVSAKPLKQGSLHPHAAAMLGCTESPEILVTPALQPFAEEFLLRPQIFRHCRATLAMTVKPEPCTVPVEGVSCFCQVLIQPSIADILRSSERLSEQFAQQRKLRVSRAGKSSPGRNRTPPRRPYPTNQQTTPEKG
ncbi:hypothetical protein DFR30_2051 [Thiogranum longum]|uniref:Uncharacterized protein n=1 Tax=Thiogranum longum TaxID=1537524 RepID=A0A4R1HA17_9GAMM|nr:hypothetical protein DFR30_2051 [Thiogranum longum]